jgi:hypothetical protein
MSRRRYVKVACEGASALQPANPRIVRPPFYRVAPPGIKGAPQAGSDEE